MCCVVLCRSVMWCGVMWSGVVLHGAAWYWHGESWCGVGALPLVVNCGKCVAVCYSKAYYLEWKAM